MNLLIDTSAYSALQKGSVAIKKILESADQIYIPTIVIAELKAGFAFGDKKTVNEGLLDKFISDPAVSVVNIDETTPDIFAEVYAQLRNKGRAIGQNDLWIASLALQYQLPLLTLDAGFASIKQLELIPING